MLSELSLHICPTYNIRKGFAMKTSLLFVLFLSGIVTLAVTTNNYAQKAHNQTKSVKKPVNKSTNIKKASVPKPQQTLPAPTAGKTYTKGPRAWALACSAVLTERNRARHDILPTFSPTRNRIKDSRELLEQYWGITCRMDWLSVCKNLDLHGHRRLFNTYCKLLDIKNDMARNYFINRITSRNPEAKHDIAIVKKYRHKVGAKSIIGWDYSRYIFITRQSYLCGYISQKEAWKHIMYAAGILHNTFSSWRELGENYLIGRQFWSAKDTAKDGYKYEDAVMMLLNMPSSPWVKLSWDGDFAGAPKINRSELGFDSVKPSAIPHRQYRYKNNNKTNSTEPQHGVRRDWF